ncbi:hypothetical protein TRFO_15365 [Tritrichomonas foetus]|uniref:DUF3737 family protein n=1 Tax=Tritrichomonas foetus TaxID=1144522 RepID=A0A1J4KX87_9EUKA|nr:hypothetical protein TRFO_15365 [Tritrichomonas foetus]|eukprot:OHT14316.1 hypothetical protein TRFO_15365 [Tritrichomonas foetus]
MIENIDECVCDQKDNKTSHTGFNLDSLKNFDDYEKCENKSYDEERPFYGSNKLFLNHCKIDGPADGESAFKECDDVILNDCDLNLRYPLWHSSNIAMINCRMPDTCRASIWYDENVDVSSTLLHGIKAFRECENISIRNCDVKSEEFAWRCRNIKINDTNIESVYPFFEAKNIEAKNMKLGGKYSFQYIENSTFENCVIDTKDAFWHSKNVTVIDSVVSGEYLAWYATDLKMIRCKIIGTQPFCYMKGLVLEDCEMINCDLSFEFTDVHANIRGSITSVKNPMSGEITADKIDDIIYDKFKKPNQTCKITIRNG